MSAPKTGALWAAAGILLAVALALLWGLMDKPSAPRGLAPSAADAETADSRPPSLLAADAAARNAVPDDRASERAIAVVEAPLAADASTDTHSWLEGVVVNADGSGTLAGIELEVLARIEPPTGGIEPDSTYLVTRVRSGEDGRFALPRSVIPPSWHAGSVPQLAFLKTEVPGFMRFQTPFPPMPLEPARVLVSLQPSAVLIGRVFDTQGAPIAHAEFALETLGRQLTGPREGIVPRKTAGSPQTEVLAKRLGERSGRFRIDLRDDEWKNVQKTVEDVVLRVSHRDLGVARVEVPAAKLAELPEARGIRDVDLGDVVVSFTSGNALHAPPALTGQLVDPEGIAIRGHTVRFWGQGADPSANPRARVVVTDTDGRFATAGLYGARMAAHSMEEGVREGLRQGEGIEVPVEAGEPLRLVWPMHRVRARLLDRNGEPVGGATVHLVPQGENDRSQEAARGTTDVDGFARDLFAPPGSTAQFLATHRDGRLVRARVEIPPSPHLVPLDLVFEDTTPGEVRLTLDPPLYIDPIGLGLMSYGGPELVVMGVLDGATRMHVPAEFEILGTGRAAVRLAPGSYLLRIRHVPEGYGRPSEPLAFEVVAGGLLDLTVPIERAALLHILPLEPSAVIALREPIDVGAPNRVWGDVERAPKPLSEDPAPLLVWNPAGVVPRGAPQMRAVHVTAGRYALRWRWEGGEQWLGEISLQAGVTARVELAGPVPTREDVGPRWLSLEPR